MTWVSNSDSKNPNIYYIVAKCLLYPYQKLPSSQAPLKQLLMTNSPPTPSSPPQTRQTPTPNHNPQTRPPRPRLLVLRPSQLHNSSYTPSPNVRSLRSINTIIMRREERTAPPITLPRRTGRLAERHGSRRSSRRGGERRARQPWKNVVFFRG